MDSILLRQPPVKKTIPGEGTYVGYFIGRERNGKGIMKYFNNDEYQGEWVFDKKHGNGAMIYHNGDEYQGAWVADKRNGTGVIHYKNHDQYQGEWVDDMRQGDGQIFYSVGTYNGQWFQDKKHGEGGMQYPDGSAYVGNWIDDKRNGEGALYDHNRQVVYRGIWVDDKQAKSASKKMSLPSLLKESMMFDDLPSKVIDVENDRYSLHLSQIDGNQKEIPIVFLAGKDLYVFTTNLIQKMLEDNTSILYDCTRNSKGDYETNQNVPYFNLRRLFTMDGLVPVKFLQKILVSSKKTAVHQRYYSVTHKINSIAKNNTLQFSAKKKYIKELLLDNKLSPIIYKLVPTNTKISRMTSKAVAASEPESAVGGFHCQDQGGMQWTVYSVAQVVVAKTRRRKSVKKTTKTKIAVTRSAENRSAKKQSAKKRSAKKQSA